MNLLDKLKEYSGNITVDQLDDELQNEIINFTIQYRDDTFSHDDELQQTLKELHRTRIIDIIGVLEDYYD